MDLISRPTPAPERILVDELEKILAEELFRPHRGGNLTFEFTLS